MYGRSEAGLRADRDLGRLGPRGRASTAVIWWLSLLRCRRAARMPADRIGPPRIPPAHERATGTDGGPPGGVPGRAVPPPPGAGAPPGRASRARAVPPLAGPRVDVDAHARAGRRVDEPLVGLAEARFERPARLAAAPPDRRARAARSSRAG